MIFESPQSAAHVDRVYQVVGDQLTILIDTREMRTPVCYVSRRICHAWSSLIDLLVLKICSILRNKFRVRTEIRQLAVGDYIVSNRVALERKTKSGIHFEYIRLL